MRQLPEQAIEAIIRGIKRGDTVAEMETLGLPQRTINALEESIYGITTIEQLMSRTVADLDKISNVGNRAIEQIFNCLERYHELEAMNEAYESAI